MGVSNSQVSFELFGFELFVRILEDKKSISKYI